MIKYSGMKAEKESAPALPAGGYICRIMNVENREGTGKNGPWRALNISFDIAEGDYNGYYRKNYENQNPNEGESKKWKGNIFVGIPMDDGSDFDDMKKRQFNNLIYVLENCNEGYAFNGDERSMKDKIVGLLFRREEWEFEGRTGWVTKAFKFVTDDVIREGKYVMPEDKPLKKTEESTGGSGDFMNIPDNLDDDGLPFK